MLDIFDKHKFRDILKGILQDYASIVELSQKSGVNRTYLSKILNLKLEKPPSPDILKAIADSARGDSPKRELYTSLMRAAGYIAKHDGEMGLGAALDAYDRNDGPALDKLKEPPQEPLTEDDIEFLRTIKRLPPSIQKNIKEMADEIVAQDNQE